MIRAHIRCVHHDSWSAVPSTERSKRAVAEKVIIEKITQRVYPRKRCKGETPPGDRIGSRPFQGGHIISGQKGVHHVVHMVGPYEPKPGCRDRKSTRLNSSHIPLS